MITRLSHASVYVKNQERALEFYTKKLGFEVRTDATLEGFRWLTVAPKGQKDLEIVLMEPKPGIMFDEPTVRTIQDLLAKGVLGAGVLRTEDCRRTYEELKARGVEFLQEPQDRPYGIEALLKDDSGNWFSLTQPR